MKYQGAYLDHRGKRGNNYENTGGSSWAERIQSTERIRFRSWKDWKLCVKDRECTSEVHQAGDCIILYMKS